MVWRNWMCSCILNLSSIYRLCCNWKGSWCRSSLNPSYSMTSWPAVFLPHYFTKLCLHYSYTMTLDFGDVVLRDTSLLFYSIRCYWRVRRSNRKSAIARNRLCARWRWCLSFVRMHCARLKKHRKKRWSSVKMTRTTLLYESFSYDFSAADDIFLCVWIVGNQLIRCLFISCLSIRVATKFIFAGFSVKFISQLFDRIGVLQNLTKDDQQFV